MLNDVSGAVSIREFEKMGATGVFDPERVACVVDHFWPAKDARSAALVARLRTFAERQGITDYWEVGATRDAGIEHAILAERGRIMPGDLLVGADSHTCTSGAFGAFATGMGSSDIAAAMALGEVWLKVPEVVEVEFTGSRGEHVTGKDLILAYIGQAGVDGANYAALEFCGEAVDELSLDGRLALCNMAVEAGAKTGMVAADETTLRWLAERVPEADPVALAADPGAPYDRRTSIDLDGMRPMVAAPSSPGNVHSIDELGRHREGRPGLRGQLLERDDHRPPPARGGAARQPGRAGRAAHRRAGDPAHLPRGPAGGAHRGLPRRRRDDVGRPRAAPASAGTPASSPRARSR